MYAHQDLLFTLKGIVFVFLYTNPQIYDFNGFFFSKDLKQIFSFVYILISSKRWTKVYSTTANFPLIGPKRGLLFDFASF